MSNATTTNGKCQVWVGGRIRETRFDAACFAAVHRRNADGSGTVLAEYASLVGASKCGTRRL